MNDYSPNNPPVRMVEGKLPILDLGPYLEGRPGALGRLAAQLRFCCEEIGFFYIENHGIPQALIDQTFDEARRFHDLPLETKMKLRSTPYNSGYMPIGGSTTKSTTVNNNTRPNVNEAYFIGRDRKPDDWEVVAKLKLRGMNQWPPEEALPGFRANALAYVAAMTELAHKMVRAYAVALDLPADHFDRAFDKPKTTLRLTHYPPVEKLEDNEFSIAPHTDGSFMTLLPQSAVKGLTIRLADGEWFEAPPLPGTYIVNTGDMLQHWSNGRFRSTPHYANNRATVARYAIPFFFGPNPDAMLECLPTCTGPDNPPKFDPITAYDYSVWFSSQNYQHMQKDETTLAKEEGRA